MGRARSAFVCTECGARAARWLGRCPTCGAWSTIVEEPETTAPRAAEFVAPDTTAKTGRPVALRDIAGGGVPRIPTGIPELDRVLGGGLVPGAVILLGGEPGIGKSRSRSSSPRAWSGEARRCST